MSTPSGRGRSLFCVSAILYFAFQLPERTSAADSVCHIQGIFVDNVHAGSNAKVIVSGATITFSGLEKDLGFPNTTTAPAVVAASSTAYGWYEMTVSGRCFLARVTGPDLELTAPKDLPCQTEWSTDGPVFSGKAMDGTQQFCDLWILGVIGAITGTFLSTLGLGLQKLTHEKLKAEGKQVENYCQYPLWVLGIFCLAVDAVLDVWTFGLAPASLLAPMASMVLVWNGLIAYCLVGERLSQKAMMGTAVIITGSICATIFSQHDTPAYSLADFGQRWSSAEVIIYQVCVVVIFVGGQMYLQRLRKTVEENLDDYVAHIDDDDNSNSLVDSASGSRSGSMGEPVAADKIDVSVNSKGKRGDNEDLEALANKAAEKESISAVADKMHLPYLPGTKPYMYAQGVYAMVAGMLGGQSIIFAKTVVELLKSSFFAAEGAEYYMAFASFPFYVFLACLIANLMIQTQLLNMAMHNFDSLTVIPIFITFYQIFGILGGAIYYNEFADFSTAQAVMFPLGCCISFCGIFIISQAVPPEKEIVDDDFTDDASFEGQPESPHKDSPTLAETPRSRKSGVYLSSLQSDSARERYRSRMSTCAGGPLLGFLARGSVIDRSGISDTIKRRRRSSVMNIRERRKSQSMGAMVRADMRTEIVSTPALNRSSTMPPASV